MLKNFLVELFYERSQRFFFQRIQNNLVGLAKELFQFRIDFPRDGAFGIRASVFLPEDIGIFHGIKNICHRDFTA